jgi:class 3 adenylate cyclase
MAAGTSPSTPEFTERKLVIMVVDLAGTTKAVARLDATEVARLINSFFASCGEAVSAHRGRIVTFLGDGCLAVFDEKCATDALDAAFALKSAVAALSKDFGVNVELGVNIHQAVVAEGNFEPDGHYNVMGTGVNYTFLMGGGPGIRISEPVYRQLPSDSRSPWNKHRPPATYTHAAG